MVRLVPVVVALVALASCRFEVTGLSIGRAPDLSARSDAAVDLASGRPVDAALDPCALPPGSSDGAAPDVTAACAIGAPPTIDGDLSDWPSGLFQASLTHLNAAFTETQTWDPDPSKNDANTSTTFALKWDAIDLYLAFRVRDDQRGVSNMTQLYEDDSVEIYFDGGYDRHPAYEADDFELTFTEDGRSSTSQHTTATAGLPAGVMFKVGQGQTAADWNLEVAVPWSVLSGAAATPGRRVGFDVQLDDNDGGQTRSHMLIWKDSMPPACACSPYDCEPWCDASTFGTLLLGSR